MMTRPETATRNETPKAEQGEPPQGGEAKAPCAPLKTTFDLVEWNTDEPFLDPDEYLDPRVHQWRETLRQRYNFNKRRQ